MLLQLLVSNISQFALIVLSSFVFFSAGLLYMDAWFVNKQKRTPLIRSVGFFLLSFITSYQALSIDIPFITEGAHILKILGLSFILFSLVSEPILAIPKKERAVMILPFLLSPLSTILMSASAIVLFFIGGTYFIKASKGLEKQLRPAGFAFLFLGIAESIRVSFYWSNTLVIYWSKLLAPFGIVWVIQHLFELAGIVILGIWVWGYIRFRIQVQLFVMTIALTLMLFVATTIFFTFLLLKNLEADALTHLRTDVNVLLFSLENIKDRTLSNTRSVAQDSNMQQAFINQDKKELYAITVDYLKAQRASTLVIASSSGEVMMRTEDQERTNDNISSDPTVKAAFNGEEVSTIVYKEGIISPDIIVKSTVPIRQGNRIEGNIIGVVQTGFSIDTAFVDGVKRVTGLDTTVFGRDKRAATTFLAPDGKSRSIGTLETNTTIVHQVLGKGEEYIGVASILNQPFYTAYAPIKSYDNSIEGMLFVGKPQNTLIDAAKQSIDLTFSASMILMVLSVIPVYFFSRFLKEHAEA